MQKIDIIFPNITILALWFLLFSFPVIADEICPYQELKPKGNLIGRTWRRVAARIKTRGIGKRIKQQDDAGQFLGKEFKTIHTIPQFLSVAKAVITSKKAKLEHIRVLQEISETYDLTLFDMRAIHKWIRKWKGKPDWNDVADVAFNKPWGTRNEIIHDEKAPLDDVVKARLAWVKKHVIDNKSSYADSFIAHLKENESKIMSSEQFTRLSIELIKVDYMEEHLIEKIREKSTEYSLTSSQILRLQTAQQRPMTRFLLLAQAITGASGLGVAYTAKEIITYPLLAAFGVTTGTVIFALVPLFTGGYLLVRSKLKKVNLNENWGQHKHSILDHRKSLKQRELIQIQIPEKLPKTEANPLLSQTIEPKKKRSDRRDESTTAASEKEVSEIEAANARVIELENKFAELSRQFKAFQATVGEARKAKDEK